MIINFLGATETVTGSKYLIETDNKKILIDCGLFQGRKELRLLNWEPLPVDPHNIDAVVLTHAHLDHSGYIPLLVKNGFSHTVYCTPATKDLCEILLRDSGHLQEEAAYFANKYGFSKHKPALPLYTREDAERSLTHFVDLDFGTTYKLGEELFVHFNRAGHILGAATVELTYAGVKVLFSGDLGRFNDPVMRQPVAVQQTDYLVIESTYGNHLHATIDPLDIIEEVINRTIARGGTIVIPAFAVGRAQQILYYVYKLKTAGKIADVPVYLDSPMATDATEIFYHYNKEHKLSALETAAVCQTAKYVRTVDESKAIDLSTAPKIIISSSGMATGGRVLHHIKAFAGDARNTILFTGYQAEGTRGDSLVRRGKREIKMFGEMVKVEAEVASLRNVSAHADYKEIMQWLRNFVKPPRKVFVTHGEKEAAHALQKRIIDTFGWDCVVPTYLQSEELL